MPGDLTYQYQWVPMLQNARGWYAKGTFGTKELPGQADDWLKAIGPQVPELVKKGNELGFTFASRRRPTPNKDGRIATTLEWAKKLSNYDIKLLQGEASFGETLPDPDEGFMRADVADPAKAQAVYAKIRERLAKYRQERPGGGIALPLAAETRLP